MSLLEVSSLLSVLGLLQAWCNALILRQNSMINSASSYRVLPKKKQCHLQQELGLKLELGLKVCFGWDFSLPAIWQTESRVHQNGESPTVEWEPSGGALSSGFPTMLLQPGETAAGNLSDLSSSSMCPRMDIWSPLHRRNHHGRET